MKLSEKRWEFSRCVAALLSYAEGRGFRLVLDEGRVFKDRVASGGKRFVDGVHIPNSKHYDGLAIDTVLYDSDWKPVTKNDPRWQELGRFWKGLHSECTWGGDFKKVDLNHFSWGER